MPNSYEGMRDVAVASAEQAAIILMERFGDTLRIASKDKINKELVTDVDLQVEGEIITVIRGEYPNHSILSEEQGSMKEGSEYKWIIDPLDGTHNYTRRLPVFGTSIALEHRNRVVLGIISLPYFEEVYVAERGKGAYLNNQKIHVSDVDLGASMMIYDTKFRLNKEPMVACLSDMIHEIFVVRMFGCAVWDLTLVAKGQAEFNVDFTAKPWDLAAGAVIVEEAGGKVTDLQGNNWSPYTVGFLASMGKVHDKVLDIINLAEHES
jgi:myo-inositol-1(or 4)-monophosphatase